MRFYKYLNEGKFLDLINRISLKFEKNFDLFPNDVVLMKKKGKEYIIYFKDASLPNEFLSKTENEKDALYVQKEANKLIEKSRKLLKRRK